MGTNEKDMTAGSPGKLIITFAIPMMLGNIFQQFYSKYVIICTLPFKKTCRPSGRHILFLLFGSKSFR